MSSLEFESNSWLRYGNLSHKLSSYARVPFNVVQLEGTGPGDPVPLKGTGCRYLLTTAAPMHFINSVENAVLTAERQFNSKFSSKERLLDDISKGPCFLLCFQRAFAVKGDLPLSGRKKGH